MVQVVSRGRNYPLPDPQKVFLNLLQKWNRYSPVNLGDNYLKFIEEKVFPAGYRLQTRIMHFDRYKQVGFTGSCTFGVRKQKDDIMIKVLHMLARFTFYAGVGYKTTMGMGQAVQNPGGSRKINICGRLQEKQYN